MQWKQKISGVLAATMLIGALPSALAWDAPEKAWEAVSREGVKSRLFVGSDIHINRVDSQKKFANALEAFNSIDTEGDATNTAQVFVGDITDSGRDDQYTTLIQTEKDHTDYDKRQTIWCIGNHEGSGQPARDQFKRYTGQEPNKVVKVGGVTVITLGQDGTGNQQYGTTEEARTWFADALKTAAEEDPTAPIFVMAHHAVPDTAYVTDEWSGEYNQAMIDEMKKYPQIIHISGHSHSTMEDNRSIDQSAGFTAIQDGTIGAYFENESGKINPETGTKSTYPANAEVSSQALVIDVSNENVVTIRRMNLTTGEYMYNDEPWVIDTPKLVEDFNANATYVRERASVAPSFEEGAAVTTSDLSETSVKVSFPAATPASGKNNDMIHTYKITLTDTATGEKEIRQFWNDYYEIPANKKDKWTVLVKDLAPQTTYSIAVQAVTSFGAESQPITAAQDITTGMGYVAPYPAKPILDVDFSRDATGEDANGHQKTVYGDPTFKMDEALGRMVASFDGVDDGLRYSMTLEDYEKVSKNFTVELYYKPKDTQNNDPMGITQSSGFCFEQKEGTNTLQFWAHIDNYKKPETTVAKDQWNHVVGTFDGKNVKMYLNGELKATVAASGALTMPPPYLFLGGDTTSDGRLEYQANCEIALARVYTGTMTADDVMAAYKAASAKPEIPATNVEVSIHGEDRVDMGAEVPFLFSMAKMERVAAATFTFEVSDKSLVQDGKLVGQNGFKLLDDVQWTEDGDKLTGKLTLSYLSGSSLTKEELTDIARLTFTAADKNGNVAVKLTGAQVAGYDENGEAVYMDSTTTESEAVTAIGSKYDVNRDGKVDLLDIVHAQKFYQMNSASENWAQAKHCDVTGDSVIDLEDLIAILHAYTA